MSGLEILGGVASSIALAQVIQGTLKAIDFLRQNSDIRKECNDLRKEILMIEYFILQAREQTDPMLPAQRIVGTFTEHPLVSLTTQELEEILEDLNSIVEKYSHARKPHDPKRYTDKVKWFSEVRKIEELRERAQATKLNLHMAITFRVSSMVDRGNMRQEVLFHRVTQQLTYHTQETHNDSRNLPQLLETPSSVPENATTTQDSAFCDIPSASTPMEEDEAEIISPFLTNATGHDVVIKEETLVSVTTVQAIGSRSCRPGCQCRCHRSQREHNGGTWARPLLGSWLVRYRAVGGPCQGKCGSNSGVEFEYQLPKWLWAGMVSFKAYQGPRIAWSLRPSRIVPFSDDIWKLTSEPSMLRKHISDGFVYFPDDTNGYRANLMCSVLSGGNIECIEVILKLWENLLPHQGLPRDVGHIISYIYDENRNIQCGDSFDTILKKVLSFVREWDDVRTTKVHRAVQAKGGLAQALREEPWAIDERDKYGMAPIHYAVRDNNLEALEHLIMAKANINQHDAADHPNLLTYAAMYGKEAMVRRLLDHGYSRRDLNQGGAFGDTALHWAAEELSAEGFGLLLNAGASASQSDQTGETPLHHLSRERKTDHQAVEEIVHLLKGHGADLEAKDEYGNTSIMLAVKHRNLAVLHALVGAGASLRAINRSQENILHMVAMYPDVDVMNYLANQDLSHVDSQLKNTDKNTPLGLLVDSLQTEEWELTYDIIRTSPSVQEAFIIFYFNSLTRDLMRHMSTLQELLQAITDRDMSMASNVIDQFIKKKTDGNDPWLVEWYRGIRGYVVDQAWDCLAEIIQEEYEEISEKLKRAYIAREKELSADEMEEFF